MTKSIPAETDSLDGSVTPTQADDFVRRRLRALTRADRIARIDESLDRLDAEQLQLVELMVGCVVRGAL